MFLREHREVGKTGMPSMRMGAYASHHSSAHFGSTNMDMFLVLGLVHVVASFVWAACVLILTLIQFAARRDDDALLRAVSETAHLGRRVLRPAILVTGLTGLALAALTGLLGEASVVLSTGLSAIALAAATWVVVPGCEQAREMPRGAALVRGRQVLRLAGLDLVGQGAAIGFIVFAPGWGGAAILGGLVACLALAAALPGEADVGEPRHV